MYATLSACRAHARRGKGEARHWLRRGFAELLRLAGAAAQQPGLRCSPVGTGLPFYSTVARSGAAGLPRGRRAAQVERGAASSHPEPLRSAGAYHLYLGGATQVLDQGRN